MIAPLLKLLSWFGDSLHSNFKSKLSKKDQKDEAKEAMMKLYGAGKTRRKVTINYQES